MSSNNLFRVLTSSICDFNVVNRNGSVRSDVAYYYFSSYCNMVHVLKIKSMLEKFPRLCIHSMSIIPMVSTATVVLDEIKIKMYTIFSKSSFSECYFFIFVFKEITPVINYSIHHFYYSLSGCANNYFDHLFWFPIKQKYKGVTIWFKILVLGFNCSNIS